MIPHTRALRWDDPAAEAIRAIRQRVFIDEQGIPADMEWDEADHHATHFLHYGADGQPAACARLIAEEQTARIGRMAVLPENRGQGMARKLLRYVLAYARSERYTQVRLSAQCYITHLYAQEGFVPEGKPHEEAGISHQNMLLVLRETQVPHPRILAEDRTHYALSQWDDVGHHLQHMIGQCRHQLLIVTHSLPARLFDHPVIEQQFRVLARGPRQPAIRILLQHPQLCVRQRGELYALLGRLSTGIEIRQPATEQEEEDWPQFIVADDSGMLYQHRHEVPEGFARYNDPARARTLQTRFESLFSHARISPEFRHLSL